MATLIGVSSASKTLQANGHSDRCEFTSKTLQENGYTDRCEFSIKDTTGERVH